MANSLRGACLVALAALLAGCDVRVGEQGGVSVGVARGKAADEWTRTYAVGPGARLEIVNVNGAIEVSGTEDGPAEVIVRRNAEGPSDEAARSALEAVGIVEEAAADRVKVEVRRPASEPFRGWSRTTVRVEYDVRVPPGLTASFRTDNGTIRLTRVAGQLSVSAANGPITAEALSGSLTASAINGSVQVGFDTVSGPVELTAVNGPIRLELPRDVKADLTVAAVNGGIAVDEAFALAAPAADAPRRTPGISKVAGRLNGGGPAIAIQTTNGAVRITARGSQDGAARTR